MSRGRTFQWLFIVQQLAKVNQPDATGACRCGLPIIPPLPQDKLLEGVDTYAEGVGVAILCLVGDWDAPAGKVFGGDAIRVTTVITEEQVDAADGSDVVRGGDFIVLGGRVRGDGERRSRLVLGLSLVGCCNGRGDIAAAHVVILGRTGGNRRGGTATGTAGLAGILSTAVCGPAWGLALLGEVLHGNGVTWLLQPRVVDG